ncbi:hypothetical protein ACHRVW_12100 [Flavobacterium collinsii]|uniref:hypothetical protein n=1 Tax=Flavobacterium collinsii TaxID=1114861 RepID=UPI003757A670
METIIRKPNKVSADYMMQILDLLDQGNQLSIKGIEKRLIKADLIAMIVDGDKVLTVAALKNPEPNYKRTVFKSAGAGDIEPQFEKELGYIVTHPEFEGQKLCQKLLSIFIPQINGSNLFATTRKDSVIHILGKFGFSKVGEPYKDGLNLLLK